MNKYAVAMIGMIGDITRIRCSGKFSHRQIYKITNKITYPIRTLVNGFVTRQRYKNNLIMTRPFVRTKMFNFWKLESLSDVAE